MVTAAALKPLYKVVLAHTKPIYIAGGRSRLSRDIFHGMHCSFIFESHDIIVLCG